MRALSCAVIAALLPLSMVACKAPPTTVACVVTEATATASCTVDGVTIATAIPPDVATVIGIVAPFSNGAVTTQSAVRQSVVVPSCSLNTNTRLVTCSNPATGEAGRTFPLQPD